MNSQSRFIYYLSVYLLVGFFPSYQIELAAQSTETGMARYALLIGNSNYAEFGDLKNPINDATDMAESLKRLGFTVELLLNADLPSMDNSVVRLGNRLSNDKNAIGFFYYAGHGIQSKGNNYLIPSRASIASESFLRARALSVQTILDTLQSATNQLNIVILDACRDNPFSWSRSSSRGLSVVNHQPPGSIIVYATSAGSIAADGTGRNGLFTTELLKHLETSGIDIHEVFNRTGLGVSTISQGHQVPAIYSQFFRNMYLSPAESYFNQTASSSSGNTTVKENGFQPLVTDYHKNLYFYAVPLETGDRKFTRYILGRSEPAVAPFSGVDWNKLEIRDAGDGKDWSGRYVNNGSSFFMLGFTEDNGTDLYHVELPSYRAINLTNDGAKSREYLLDFVEVSQRVLFKRFSQSGQYVSAVDTSALWYRTSDKIPGSLEAAVWDDDSGEKVWLLTKNQEESMTIWQWDTDQIELVHNFTFPFSSDYRYLSVLDYNRKNKQLLMRLESNCILHINIPQGEAHTIVLSEFHAASSNGFITGVHWNESGTTFTYRYSWYDDEDIPGGAGHTGAGVFDVIKEEGFLLPQNTLSAFWFSDTSLGYFRNITLPSGRREMRLFKANAVGRGEVSLMRFKETSTIGLLGWDLEEFTGGKACPFVYVIGADNSRIFIGEAIKDAITPQHRLVDRLDIPATVLQKNGYILLQENLSETSFFFSIQVEDEEGFVPLIMEFSSPQSTIPYILQQGDWMKLIPQRTLIGKVELVADGYYLPDR